MLLVLHLFNSDSSKSTHFMLNTVFDVLMVLYFLPSKSEFFVSCCIKITRTSFYLLCLLISGLHLGGNKFLFCFDICIKFTLSAMKK